ncbi:TlpA family protein disulfide reductase [Flavobacterium alkalisoli]|uniref:TlpA family protein disulfide reductase n=1 Tax=Flavobacterium alkalisoli TaxID=2602769 RepID=UPI003A90616C
MKKMLMAGLSAIFLLYSCNEKKENSTENTNSYSKGAVAEINKPQPIHVYEKGGVKVNAYNYNGLEYFLTKSNDTTYVVNFWATWCVPCVEELPYFEKLNAGYADKKVKVLLVSLDMHKKIESNLIPFIDKKKLQSDVVLLRDPDADTWIRKIDTTWSGAIPATIMYNKDNRKFFEQQFTYEELEKELNNFIKP